MLFYCKKYKYRATFCRVKAKEKSVWKKNIYQLWKWGRSDSQKWEAKIKADEL
jgi:hypothetical protein